MIRIRASAPKTTVAGYVRRTAHIESTAGIDDIWFMTPEGSHPLSDDWLLPVGVMVGMSLGEDVHVEGRVSEQLFTSMDGIQRFLEHRKQPRPRRVRFTTDEVAPTPKADRPRVVACFSGGVDAFYTVLEIGEQIDELLYVHGFEAYTFQETVLAHLLPNARDAAVKLGKHLRLAETNYRSVIQPLADHSYFTSIPMVFAIAYLMGSDLTRLVVPETHDPFYSDVNHPMSAASYVGLWGTEGVEVVEHGHVRRLEKVRRIAQSDLAMRHLRVCWDQKNPALNCGRCVKCMRTRVHLKLAGVEGRCKTLPPRLGLGELRRAEAETEIHENYVDENIAEAESQGLTDFAAALRIQRENLTQSPQSWRARTESVQRFFRNLIRSVWRRRGGFQVRRLKDRCGEDHLFNCFGTESRERRT